MANRHFDTYIKGSHPPRPIKDTPAKDTSTTDTLTNASAQPLPQPLTNIPLTYAQAATTALIVCESTACKRYLAKIHLAYTTRPNTHLFACIRPDHSACKVGAFAILTTLKKQLKDKAYLFKEVQAVKSGYALCTDLLKNLNALNKFANRIANTIGNCIVEKQVRWTTYRLDNILRTVCTLLKTCTVDTELLTNAITNFTSQSPTCIVETL
jgi:hypothetical protein